MNFITLMYHDVASQDAFATSGFAGAGADLYKLATEDFNAHLNTIAQRAAHAPVRVCDVDYKVDCKSEKHEARATPPLMLTFDDGGASAHTIIAPMLEARGWRAHFFVSTNRINTPEFLSHKQIVDLHNRGHIIGSHSHSHPLRMAHLSPAQLACEWQMSVGILSDITGERVTTASIPGGGFSLAVAETAAASGIENLFTSEPVRRARAINGCTLFGRYAVQRRTSPNQISDLIGKGNYARHRQYALWNFKKVFKRVGGENFLKLRQFIIERGS